MKEVKITIPDNCELIKEGDTYVVREKENNPPRSWKEFCDRYPLRAEEAYIEDNCNIEPILESSVGLPRQARCWRNLCTSIEEAEAFLALMQLRQLRKAWVGDWKAESYSKCSIFSIVWSKETDLRITSVLYSRPLDFPTEEMARDFLSCFGGLLDTAKILL